MIPVMEPCGPPQLVIVGRPNVGKSTLFNRITRSRRSIVGDEPGITRDRICMPAEWQEKTFEVTDTGGMAFTDEQGMPALVSEQAQAAILTADHIIFVVDGRNELTAADWELSRLLHKSNHGVSLAVNKCDNPRLDAQHLGFFDLGFKVVVAISAEHDRGIEDLLQSATKHFPDQSELAKEKQSRDLRISILGHPNVGKSTLLNRITATGHAIVSDIPGTTRDAVDATKVREGERFVFIDTAGIRRKGKTHEMTEKLSIVMTQRHLRMSDVSLLLVDPREGVTAQDAHIAGYIHEAGKACIVVANKWDLSQQSQGEFRRHVRDQLKFMDYAPVAFISALTGERVDSLFPLIKKCGKAARQRIPTSVLNRFLAELDMDRVTVPGHRKPKLSYVTQVSTAPPNFLFFCNKEGPFHFGLTRYLTNQLRAKFGFQGTPIIVRSKKQQRSRRT